MFLKRLEAVGFKSFAEKISIEFVHGVNTVVGPNGSGKSNIIDAIRWVLGEQSAKSLRGAKMEDVIFIGSDSRKPLNVAEVSLILDNSDGRLPYEFNEISVTRRVYRTGESDFFINKKSCRLKDIIDLFMDSGLGKEAFSIISQGKIEEILSSKPEERRSIFEEASGVLKYKMRKKKAEQKLNEAWDNLHRVEDILYELESQVEPLKLQASLAKEYLEKKQECDQLDIALVAKEIGILHDLWEQAKITYQNYKEQEIKQSTSITKKEAELVGFRNQLEDLDASLNSLQEVLLLTSSELEKLEGQKALLEERTSNTNEQKTDFFNRIEQLQNSSKEASKYVEECTIEKKKITKALKDVTELLNSVSIQLEDFEQNIENKIESLKADYIDYVNDQAQYRNELRFVNEQWEKSHARFGKIESDASHFLNRLEETKKIVEEKKNEKETVALAITNLEKQNEESKQKVQELDVLLIRKREEYEKGERLLNQLTSKKSVLEEMEDDFAGYYQGVKEVLKASLTNLHGIEGAVAQKITVNKEIEKAIDVSLGASMQHIITADENSARSAIAFLKQNRFGRATFLPLSVISKRSVPLEMIRKIEHHPSFVGVASNLVQCEQKYKIVLEHLIGQVVIVKDLVAANEIAKILSYRYRVVTLEGDVVNTGGSMTGGSVKQQQSSLLSRQRELEEIAEKISMLTGALNLIKDEVTEIQSNKQRFEESSKEFTKEIDELRTKLFELEKQYQSQYIELQNIVEKEKLFSLEEEQYKEEAEYHKKRKKELEVLLLECQKKMEFSTKKIQELEGNKLQEVELKKKLQKDHTKALVEKAQLEQKLQQVIENADRYQLQKDESENELEVLQQKMGMLHGNLDDYKKWENDILQKTEQKQKDKDNTVQIISERRAQRTELYQKVQIEEEEVKELKRLYKHMLEAVTEEEVRMNRLDVDLDYKLRTLSEEFELSYEAAKEQYPLEMTVEEAKKTLRLLKLSIDELGTVNIGAIDEYDRVKERYEFLTAQRQDLLDARDTLLQVIEEMDEEMKRKFDMTFTAIKSQFEGVFKELFGGGRADLVLTNPDDLLETGIDIIAQPPGKKLQNLSLLSGGERALTAIALLFSILKVRPVPFCILDEVEAALDEANVTRYAQYLKKFSNETQFIVITHRKGTMEESDVLYGVTMQESGVSKIVSVRFEEVEEISEQIK